MVIRYYVMHATFEGADRGKYVKPMLDRLPPDRTHVVESPTREGSWHTAERCWRAGLASDATHIVVLNDDVLPVVDFDAHLTRAISVHPDKPISLYTKHKLCPQPSETCWHTSPNGMTVAIVLPATLAREFLEWYETRFHAPRPQHRPKDPGVYPSDAMVDLFLMATDRFIYTTVPALVEHEAPDDSLLGNNGHPGRRALVTGDPPLDWSQTPKALGPVFHGTHWHLISHVKPPMPDKAYAIERRKVW